MGCKAVLIHAVRELRWGTDNSVDEGKTYGAINRLAA
jgi:hypothetical protein